MLKHTGFRNSNVLKSANVDVAMLVYEDDCSGILELQPC